VAACRKGTNGDIGLYIKLEIKSISPWIVWLDWVVMMALAIGSDKMSTLAKREGIIAGLTKLPGSFPKL
jgi:hypothetical protein